MGLCPALSHDTSAIAETTAYPLLAEMQLPKSLLSINLQTSKNQKTGLAKNHIITKIDLYKHGKRQI
jgi:hypothetical protein